MLAQQAAREHGGADSKVDIPHILLGLILEEEGLACRVLTAMNVTEEKIRSWMEDIGLGRRGVTGGTGGGSMEWTPEAKKVLELALREALGLGHNYIGTEHILLGIVRDPNITDEVLLHEQVQDEVIRMLSGPTKNTPPSVDPLRPKSLTVSFEIEPGQVWIDRETGVSWYVKHTDREIVLERTVSEQHDPHDFVRNFRKMGER